MLFVSFLRHSPSHFPEGNLVWSYIRVVSPTCTTLHEFIHPVARAIEVSHLDRAICHPAVSLFASYIIQTEHPTRIPGIRVRRAGSRKNHQIPSFEYEYDTAASSRIKKLRSWPAAMASQKSVTEGTALRKNQPLITPFLKAVRCEFRGESRGLPIRMFSTHL